MNRGRILCSLVALIGAINLAFGQGQGKVVLAPSDEWEWLKSQVAEQRDQIQQLTAAIEEQKKMTAALMKSGAAATDVPRTESATDSSTESASGEVPSLSPIIASRVIVKPVTQATGAAGSAGEAGSQLQFRIGTAAITPVGFMDFTSVSRSTNAGTGIGSNFGSIPFANSAAGSLTETKLSAQNSRFGFRVDAAVNGANVLAYMESDFVSQLANPPNGTIAVSSNSYPLRLRLYWADVRKDKFEFLAGQSWSLVTPNRKGMSALPGDLFFTQDIDVNYQAGLVWGRIPGFRLLYHFSPKTAFGVSLENAEPYVGGSAGGGVITPPAALAGLLGTQLNNGGTVLGAPALHPDIIAKFTFDPSSRFHIEAAGLETTAKIVNTNTSPFTTFTKAGVGGSINLNFELVKNFRIFTNNYYSDGGGRYIFGQAPDLIVRADGSLSPIHSGSTLTGAEVTAGQTLIYSYYGGVYIQRNTALDANGTTRIGYGFIGSGGGQNRTIQQFTFGTNTTLWRDARYGALNLMFQYSYLQRNPWSVATGQPLDAHTHIGFMNLRYTLPGSAPAVR